MKSDAAAITLSKHVQIKLNLMQTWNCSAELLGQRSDAHYVCADCAHSCLVLESLNLTQLQCEPACEEPT